MDFIKRMRENCEKDDKNKEKKKNNENENENMNDSIGNEIFTEDNSLSTQNMINDARERRLHKEKLFQCDNCDYKSGSRTLLEIHKQTLHDEYKYPYNQCDYKEKMKDNL